MVDWARKHLDGLTGMVQVDIDVGNPEMDQDHHALAQLIEKVGSVCGDSLKPGCKCDQCPEGKPERCFDALIEIANEIMVRMLEHFDREDDLMKSLPHNRSTREHCMVHRREHVDFSTRYNLALAHINARYPVVGLRILGTFILDWIRSHILEYDMKLAALLREPLRQADHGGLIPSQNAAALLPQVLRFEASAKAGAIRTLPDCGH